MNQRKNQKQILWLLSLVLAFIYSKSIHAKDLYLTGKAGTYNFSVDNNGTSSISGMGAYSLDLAYPLAKNLMVSLIFNTLVENIVSGDMGYGFDIAIKHYPVSSAGFYRLDDDKLDIRIADLYRPYYGIAFRQREFVLILSTSYVGPGFFTGIDYQLNNKWYFNFEFRYDNLQGPREATATQMNILFGLGKEI